MANEEQLARLEVSIAENNGCASWNQWRKENSTIKIDLSDAQLCDANLTNVDLSGAIFRPGIKYNVLLILMLVLFLSLAIPIIIYYHNYFDGLYNNTSYDVFADGFVFAATGMGFLTVFLILLFRALAIRAASYKTNMRNVNLSNSKFINANLGEVILSNAILKGADFRSADLRYSELIGANLVGACLIDAILADANFSGTRLNGVQLTSADLIRTNLRKATIDRETMLANPYLTQLDWRHAPLLTDEDIIAKATTRQTRVVAYRSIARSYRELANELRSKGLLILASGYRLRGERIERRGFFAQGKIFSWLGALILDLLSGYGERANRTFLSYLVVVFGFAAIFFVGTHTVDTKLANLTWNEALILSLTSFHGRGFFPGSLPLDDWAAGVAAAEAVIGLFIELILIATFSRRFLGN